MENSTTTSLPESYQKARKNYGLFASVLLAWELIGVDVDQQPFNSFNIGVKTPEAAPFILLVIILYFSYRVTLEWYLFSQELREKRVIRIDFVTSHIIGLLGILAFIIQKITDLQLYSFIKLKLMLSVTFATFFLVAFIVLGSTIYTDIKKYLSDSRYYKIFESISVLLIAVFFLGLTTYSFYIYYDAYEMVYIIVNVVIGIIAALGLILIVGFVGMDQQ